MNTFATSDRDNSRSPEAIAAMPLAVLAERAPGVSAIFVSLGLDMCCGGSRPLDEALRLHGIEAEPVIEQISTLMAESQDW